jgi:hypothetical protein
MNQSIGSAVILNRETWRVQIQKDLSHIFYIPYFCYVADEFHLFFRFVTEVNITII